LNISLLNRSGLKLEKFTPDPFFSHEIKISQPENGYRFSLDPFILANQIKANGNEKIIDIGCGCGIIPLLLAFKRPDLKIFGVEIQKELYRFARQNIIINRLEKAIRIIHGNIKDIKPFDIDGQADIIVSNPPYIKKNCGRLNPDSLKAIARHEVTLDIDMLFACSNKLLNEKGKLYIIFPAERLSDLILTMANYHFFPAFIRFVHIKQKTKAKRVILCAVKNTDNVCVVHPPFFVYTSENKFSPEYASLFNKV